MNKANQELRRLFKDAVPGVDGTYKVFVGRGGSWLRNLLPGLWDSSQRIVGVGNEELVLLGAGLGYKLVKRTLWRGPLREVELRSYMGDRALRLRMPNGRRVQLDGKAACTSVREAWQRSREGEE